jgi:hypothetical protein
LRNLIEREMKKDKEFNAYKWSSGGNVDEQDTENRLEQKRGV